MSRGRIIFVEGNEDIRALRALGISGDMFPVQSSGGPVRAAEYAESEGRRSVVLTDWDRRGRMLADRLSTLLPPGTADLSVRNELARLCGPFIWDVESLDSFVAALREGTDRGHRF